MTAKDKPRIGITIGDFNGIGPEILLKAYNDNRMFEFGVPVVYASPKIINHYKHLLKLDKLQHQILKNKDIKNLQPKILNIVNCLDDSFDIKPGEASDISGQAALTLIDEALDDLKAGYIDLLVTCPVNKNTIVPKEGTFSGHTEYIAAQYEAAEPLMFLVSDGFRMGLVTTHIPIKDVAATISTKKILDKLRLMNHSLIQDFGCHQPRIAVFGLNPHAGDNGLIGKEEKEIIYPAIVKAQEEKILAYGPYPADGFMGAGHFKKFDAVLAMYHDQGLVAFKSVVFSEGVNYTAGLPIIRTSPDHGTAFDIAGKDLADENSLREAIFLAADIFNHRREYELYASNPLVIKEKKSE
ncbi:MAG: 4-hydroxythreonine-4-phosphate dehydrogenase PdxA [Chitinophagales bacterium]|nr:4-hydroxythreonine-4-phosphate dehydrogenase PdxA [Chitinophagales bacterium]